MKRNRVDRGIVLIITLFTLVFILMITTTIVIISRDSSRWTGRHLHQERALNAAMSGMAYAKMRIQKFDKEKKLWQGAQPNGTGGYEAKAVNPDLNSNTGFSVVEKHIANGKGVVEGTLSGNGPTAKFFIYFAPPSQVEFEDKDVGKVTAKYLSLNNSASFTNTKSKLIDNSTKYRDVPYCTSLIVVQGVCNGVEKHVETMMLKYPSAPFDAAGVSNGDMSITLNGSEAQWYVSAVMDMPALIRANGNLNVTCTGNSNDFIDFNGGKAKAQGDVTVFHSYISGITPSDLGLLSDQGYQGAISNMSFSNLTSFLKQSQPVNLKAGTYIFSENDGQLQIEYKSESGSSVVYENNSAVSVNNPYQAFSFGKNLEDMEAAHKVIMNSPINVVQSGNETGIVIKGADDLPYELSVNMNSTDNNTVYISNSVGDVKIDGEITGKGGVFSNGNISFEGRSALSAEAGTVCLYADGDINLTGFSKPIEQSAEGNPSAYIAQAALEALDNRYTFKIIGKFKSHKLLNTKNAADKLLDEKVNCDGTEMTLEEVLANKFKYTSDNKREEVVNELLRNNCDGTVTVGLIFKQRYYKFHKDRYESRFQAIIDKAQAEEEIEDKETNDIDAADQIFQGIIYARGNVNANLSNNKFTVKGSIVSKEGNINIESNKANFLYDPKYLEPLYDLGNFSYRQLYWTVH